MPTDEMTTRHERLPVASIEYDRENPRIKVALEKYGDKLDAERIYFALRTATEGEKRANSYDALLGSIRADGGIRFPIVVVERDGGFTCIDGNTRLAIYKQFQREGASGDWDVISATVMTDPGQKDIEAIRISAHLVGAREWPAYEKARYLHYLRSEKLMDYSEMIALCGGRRSEIEQQIDAFHEMNEYYRDVVDDTAFHIDRFSGFVELQKRGVKDAIYDAGFGLKDFGEWIRHGKIYRLADVRRLRRVLSDPEATRIFVTGGPRSIEAANQYLDQQRDERRSADLPPPSLADASLTQLARALSRRIDEMPYSALQDMRDKESTESQAIVDEFDGLAQRLRRLLEDMAS